MRKGEVLKTGLIRGHTRRSKRGRRALILAATLMILVAAVMLLLPATGALAAVTSIYSNSAVVTGATSATSISVTYTSANTGADRLMMVGVAWNCGTSTDNDTISTATYTPSGGSATAMTLLYDYDVFPSSGTITHRHNAVYYVVSPPSGAGQVDIAFTSGGGDGVDMGIVAGVTFFTGVSQSTPLGTYDKATGGTSSGSTAATITLNGLNGDELVFDSLFRGGTSTQTPGAGQTALWNTGVSNARGAASYEQATSSSVVMSWGATSGIWATIAVPIKPAPTGPTHTLTMQADPSGGGTITPAAGPHTYAENAVVDVTATAAVGYVFTNWTGGVANPTSATTTVTMDADKTVTANFTVQNYDLTMAVSPSGGGTTTPAVGVTSHGARSVVDITATPNTGYLFDSWTGSVADPNDATTTVTMDGNKTVTANFTAIPPGTVVPDGTPSHGVGLPNATGITFSHSSGTGSDRLLLVGISWNCGTVDRSISSITWNGTPLIEVKTQLGYNSGNPRYAAIYKLVDPPSGVTGDVVITFSGAVTNGAIAGAANFASVDQTTPLGTPAGAGSATSDPTATVDVTGLAGNELVFDNVFMGASSTSTTFTPGAGQSQLWLVNGYAVDTGINGMDAASTKQATGTSVTMSWTTSTSARWAIAAVPIRPTSDTAGPTVTVEQAAAQADPTNAGPINFTVTFSEPVSDFATGDVTIVGTAGATTGTVTGSGTTYNVAVSGMSGSGTVIASVNAGVAHDSGNNANSASTSSDDTVTYDNVAPTVTIIQAAAQADPTNASPINFTVTFSEPVTGFATGDVTLGGTAGATTGTVTGSGTTYDVAVSGMTGSGTVIATVAASKAVDAAGNNNAASTSTDNTVTYTVTTPLALTTGWNLVAAAPGTSFPGGLWAWEGGSFQSVLDPVAWNGYWYKSATDQNVDMYTVEGPKTFDLTDDWNLIGNSMATPATVTVPQGSGLVVWAWVVVEGSGSFQSVTTLQPGQGGWVKATAGQQLTLTAAGGAPAN